MNRFVPLPAALAVLVLGTPAAFAQKAPSDPLQNGAYASVQDDSAKSKSNVKEAKKKTAEPVTNKPEPYVLDGKATGTTASGANSRGNTTSMTTPQPGRGGPLPPGVTDPPAVPTPAPTAPAPAPAAGG